jgi:hypothetical protein
VWFLVVMGTPRRSALAFICIDLPIRWQGKIYVDSFAGRRTEEKKIGEKKIGEEHSFSVTLRTLGSRLFFILLQINNNVGRKKIGGLLKENDPNNLDGIQVR